MVIDPTVVVRIHQLAIQPYNHGLPEVAEGTDPGVIGLEFNVLLGRSQYHVKIIITLNCIAAQSNHVYVNDVVLVMQRHTRRYRSLAALRCFKCPLNEQQDAGSSRFVER